ncbi:MAG: ATP-dependent sacrificial sulfur transferase LarE [Planctomycetota bacterium]
MAGDPHLAKVRALERRLAALDGLAVAFSGGVDSSVLLHAAQAALGERAVGIVADSPSLPRSELAAARALAARIGVRLIVAPTAEMESAGYRANAGDRCYFCKQALFDAMEVAAKRHGIAHLAFGEIADDLADDRPGRRAATERGVLAPLRDAGFTKEDVRRYARDRALSVADKPASACLASRIPVGTAVTMEALARVEAAEEAVRRLGFRVLRVRHHGQRARLEVGADELARAEALRPALAAALRAAGFAALDLAPYRPPGR